MADAPDGTNLRGKILVGNIMRIAYMNWSGGKDSSLALYHSLNNKEYTVGCLLTSIDTIHDRVSMHGIRRKLLEKQAASLGLPLNTLEMPKQPSMNEYEGLLSRKQHELKVAGYSQSIFGDIFLEDLRKYREESLATIGIKASFPLWKTDTKELITQFLDLGFKAIVVCINDRYLDKSFCGRRLDEAFIRDLPAGVDPCGENGEFHTFVFDGPLFNYPVSFTAGEHVYKEYTAPKSDGENGSSIHVGEEKYGFWFCDLY